MRRLILPLLAGIFFLVFQTTFLSFLPLQRVRPERPPHLHPLSGIFILADFRGDPGILFRISNGSVFRKLFGPLYLFQAPRLLRCPTPQRAILFGRIWLPIPFCLSL